MTPLTEILRDAIRRTGPLRFDRFMESALYHPEFGYYMGARDPFGIHGDFYTAAQLQPEFGDLMAQWIESLAPGKREELRVADLGAGREEMREAFSRFQYLPVNAGAELPRGLQIVFANEFFDALPVRAGVVESDVPCELLVDWSADRFIWRRGEALSGWDAEYVERYWSPRANGDRFEIGERALEWVDRIAASIDDGWLIAIDYGHRRAETARFPQGTLMSYHRHAAMEDVLLDPGQRDITAHVSFDAMTDRARSAGFESVEVRTLGSVLLETLERGSYLENAGVVSRQRVKSLVFGMGESFRVLLAGKKKE